MNSSATIQKVLKRIRGKGKGWVFTPKDLLDFDNRSNIDTILQKVMDDGLIQRLDRGIYYYPKAHPKLGVLSPDPLQIAQAIARQKGDVAFPDGAKALNMLGLSTQVPAKNIYYTNFTKRDVTVGAQKISLLPSQIKTRRLTPGLDYLILQALRYLGEGNITEDIVQACARMVSDKDKKRLQKQIPTLKGTWLVDAVRRITQV
ncbi:DUF6088 family protein [Paremcibacter congregatus]|uniref:DUF6088 family protein n=1 Tax=Paremcibacter congregatus TaxID=2043170 RepID=UPI003A9133EE